MTDQGARWSSISLPLARRASRRHGRRVPAEPGVAIGSVAFTSSDGGMLLDSEGRLWKTRDGGRAWSEVLSAGGSEGVQLAFANPTEGFMAVRRFGADSADAYVLRTTDGGATWHPQELTLGALSYGSLIASSGLDAAALIDSHSVSGEELGPAAVHDRDGRRSGRAARRRSR